MIRPPHLLRRAVPLFLLHVLPASVSAQAGRDLLERFAAVTAERMAGIENVTMTQETSGMGMTTQMVSYMEVRDMGGHPQLVPVRTWMNGREMTADMPAQDASWMNQTSKEWLDRMEAVGTEEVDGHEVHVFEITDFEGLPMFRMRGPGGDATQWTPTRMSIALDPEDLVMRRTVMEGEMTTGDGRTNPMTMTMYAEDYREADGFLYPARTRMLMDGMAAMVPEGADRAAMDPERMRERMKDMPEAQRAMMESAMKRMESMMGGKPLETVVTVVDVKVNAGPPGA